MKNIKTVSIIVCIAAIVFLVIGIGYAAFRSNIYGSGVANVAKPIYSVDVKDANSVDKLNSYYDITIKNYNENNEISDVSLKYNIDIESKDGKPLPEYVWYDSEGNELAKGFEDSLTHTTKDENKYTICFINSGTRDFEQKINFKVKVIQKDPSQNK